MKIQKKKKNTKKSKDKNYNNFNNKKRNFSKHNNYKDNNLEIMKVKFLIKWQLMTC